MSEIFLRLLREELGLNRLGPLPQQRYLEIEERVVKVLLRIHELDETGLEVLLGVIKRLNNDVEKYVEIRALKAALTREIPENTIDYDVIKAFIILLRVEKNILSPFTVKHANKLLYLFIKPCVINEKKFKKNDISELSIAEAVIADLYECGRILEKPIVKMISSKSNIS